MKLGHLKNRFTLGRALKPSLLLCLAFLFSGCSVWNPWGYSKDWPLWKKTLFFAGPGHCPVCYCVGGGVIQVVKSTVGDRNDARDREVMVAMAGNQVGAGAAIPNREPLPWLVDLGADKCIPCKMMAPILEELKKEYAGKLQVTFIDVWKDKRAGTPYGIKMIPTQIFFDASGKELFRHEGFFAKGDILAKWKELGLDLAALSGAPATITRLEPAKPDTRAKDAVCYMCDGDVNPKTRVTLKTPKGEVQLCSPHCYFILYSSLTDRAGVHERAMVTDWSTGRKVAAATASYLVGTDENRRPFIKAFAGKDEAAKEMKSAGGDLVNWQGLEEKEMATRCGFCDRAVYPIDSAMVQVDGGLHTWGCCPMCALGVAARLKKDISVEQFDALTRERIRLTTLDGSVAALEPQTAVAWAGMKKGPDGKLVSTGCFKQAVFVSDANLKKWLEIHPIATGKQITINQALAEKMKLSPEQISKACKIGECAPK